MNLAGTNSKRVTRFASKASRARKPQKRRRSMPEWHLFDKDDEGTYPPDCSDFWVHCPWRREPVERSSSSREKYLYWSGVTHWMEFQKPPPPPTSTSPHINLIRRTPNDTGDKECQNCGLPNPIWSVPNELWNRVMGGPNQPDDPGGVLCPTCFMNEADDVLSPGAWLVTIDDLHTNSDSAKGNNG